MKIKPFEIGDLVRIKEHQLSDDKLIHWIVHRIIGRMILYPAECVILGRGHFEPLYVNIAYIEHAKKIVTNDSREWLVVNHAIPLGVERYVSQGKLHSAAENKYDLGSYPIVRPWVIYRPGILLPSFTPDPENYRRPTRLI